MDNIANQLKRIEESLGHQVSLRQSTRTTGALSWLRIWSNLCEKLQKQWYNSVDLILGLLRIIIGRILDPNIDEREERAIDHA